MKMRYRALIGKHVYDADGRPLGRVEDLVAERRGRALRVTELVVGPIPILMRIGIRPNEGARVEWREVKSFEPDIRLRRTAPGKEQG